ncbi:MAG TPA: flagellar biosynthesis anti-sigma factor FlgM [Deltaproteobacteria bacterium]|nr:MAG: flagellar biosynthesis anti-sigma factor FlgM [Deltaproteobacteria bacterium GWA2_55_82]OGQ62903.1 MAG: flagellar biosynthesis anti-sigma factor FlgM [Deltaproteobacteria bacterium RIFCSPLOWO2_02_FULL_55_12]OIJ72864.1 MAG: flagellar biosynthesis anti-sigma factor FlgM [Deltaproteobacteria bacterium GWC2_55_46]HBG46145.1 flagellar biosynthesis anti-sigma factor FlgM [Deltaproteobacteria bacterium]HCY11643.1 flagellar biosynthesis anti-sigma factor FlgM [Deltaproteobacteria bacterium]
MKIGGKKPGGVGTDNFVKKTGEGGGNVKKNDAPGGNPSGDSVDISSKARELNKAKALLDSVPDVRVEKVEKLKNDVENGDYEVDAGKVAEKMIERAVRDALHTKK